MKSMIYALVLPLLSSALVGPGFGQETPQAPQPESQASGGMGGGFGLEAKAVVPELAKLLADPRPEMRQWAAIALGRIGPDARGAVTGLSGLLNDGEPALRQAAADALAAIGPAARKAAPTLAGLLRDPTQDVHNAASKALSQIGPGANAAVPEATSALDDCQWDVRRAAADALGGIGQPAAAAVPALMNHLADPDPAVRIAAANALMNVSPKPAETLPSVVKLIHDIHPGVRAAIADLLGGVAAKQSIPAAPDSGRTAALALVGSLAKQSIAALTEAMGDCEYRVRIAAVRSLGQMAYLAANPDFPAITASLRDKTYLAVAALLRDDVDDVRQQALAAMIAIKGG